MKRLSLLAAILTFGTPALAADGKAIFEASGCGACHQAKEAAVGPSVAEIAKKYAKKEKELVVFLEGTGKPIMIPEKFPMMKPNLEKTAALSKEERQALAKFLLGGK